MGGDPKLPSQIQTAKINTRAFNDALPKLMSGINSTILPSELARINAAEAVTPRYTALSNEANNSVRANSDAMDLALLDTYGRDKAAVATEIDKGINPEFYQAKEGVLSSLLSQLSNLRLDQPNVEAERLVNAENVRSGNNNVPARGVTAVGNALQFEGEKLKRSNALSAALNTTNDFLRSSRATFDPFGKSTVTDQTSNGSGVPAATSFDKIGTTSAGFGESLLGNIFNSSINADTQNANRRDSLDRVNETMSSLPSYS